jgi:radical SAM superfamily enzyme YgiQ (UPF0313 family)
MINMNVYLIKASAPGPFKEYKKAMGAPPQNIFSLAAATPQGIGISLCDETIGMKPKLNLKAEIVVLLFHTPDAIHAYSLADKFRAKGKTVVLGGLHPSFMPDEAAEHADTLLLGEAEGIWEDLINDYKNQTLKKKYKREQPVDLAAVKPYPSDIISPAKYKGLWSVLVSRGCVHRCDYCAVPPFFCGKYRLRPIENIIDEIRSVPTDWFELHADNLTANREYALKLFKALTPLKINWVGEATIKMADDEQLLKAAAKSGCKGLLIGIETPSQAALKESGKGFVSPDQIKEKIDQFHNHGIKITSSMIFGFDTHTKEIFQESEDFCRYIGIDEVESVLLIPFPGTPLFERLSSEKRLLTKDWSKYDGNNVVFKPSNMTPDELKEGSVRFWQEIRKKKSIKADSKSSGLNRGTRGSRGSGPNLTTGGTPVRWKSIVALGMIGAGLYFEWYWIWGALLVIWAITDLRNQRTYLLDDIPRSESPLLYWIVVLMWLAMGLWALSTSPAISGFAATSKIESTAQNNPEDISKVPLPESPGTQNIGSGHSKTEIKDNLNITANNHFGFSFRKPKDWELAVENDPNNVIYNCKNKSNTATVSVVAIDYQVSLTIENFISHMENEIQKELPFVKKGKPANNIEPIIINSENNKMIFREYNGRYEREEATALVGYCAKDNIGYSIIGVFGKRDSHMKTIVKKSLKSFRLSKKL